MDGKVWGIHEVLQLRMKFIEIPNFLVKIFGHMELSKEEGSRIDPGRLGHPESLTEDNIAVLYHKTISSILCGFLMTKRQSCL